MGTQLTWLCSLWKSRGPTPRRLPHVAANDVQRRARGKSTAIKAQWAEQFRAAFHTFSWAKGQGDGVGGLHRGRACRTAAAAAAEENDPCQHFSASL